MTNENIYNNLLAQLDRLFRHNRQGSYKTRERYYKAMKRFCRFLADEYHLEKLSNIAPKHIHAYAEYAKGKRLAASTIKTDLSAIRFWHDQMPDARYTLPANAALSLERRSFGNVNRTWSGTEFNRFLLVCLQHGREDYAAVARLARYAGLRISECFKLDTATAAEAVESMALTIKGKGGKVRTVPIDSGIRNELERILGRTRRGYKLFLPDDMPTHRAINNFQQFIAEHRREVQDEDSGRPMTFHGLRHTFALEKYGEYIAAGYSELQTLRKVSVLLGHERPDVTRIYLAGLDGGDDVMVGFNHAMWK